MKKQLAFLLALLLLAPTIASCGDSAEETTAETAPADTTAEETETELSDDIPDIDFGGESFTFLTSDVGHTQHAITVIQEQTGDVLNDAMYDRTMATAEKYNIAFNADEVTPDSASATNAVKNAVQAGDPAYDITMLRDRDAFAMTHQNFFTDIASLPHVNLEKPYWLSGVNEVINFSDSKFLTYGSMVLSLYDMTHIMLFNKNMITDLGLQSPYDLVIEDTWTMDVFAEMGNIAKQDADGDGAWGENDIYGVVGATNGLPMNFLASSKHRTITTDGQGGVSIMLLEDPKIEEIFTNMCDILWDTGFWYTKSTDANNYWRTETFFQTDQALFADHTFFSTMQLRDMESDFGIVPFPKYDESQEGYGVMVEGGIRAMTVPATNNKPEITGAVMETMNFLSWRDVMPAYYETTLKQKVSRDDISSRMLDLIMDSIYYDLGATMFCSQIKDGIFTNLFGSNSRTFVSKVTSQISVIEKAITAARGE